MNTSKERKETPVFSGVLQYFPDAINAVARQSWAGNEKHNPGEPLHWAREKSNDHMDCAIRHMMTPNEIDPETGGTHLVAAAWRVLAALQLQQEAKVIGARHVQEAPVFGCDGETFTLIEHNDFGRVVGDRIHCVYCNEWGIIQEIEEVCSDDFESIKFVITVRPVETTS